MIFINLIVILSVLYILSTFCHRGHKALKAFHGWGYAHRGLYGNGVPENSMAAFRASLEGGYGIELDVHLMKDGKLAVIHDHSLQRTAGADVMIEDLCAEELKNYPLEGTDQTIPLFEEVLDLYAGKAPIIVELKTKQGNHAALTEAVCKMLDGYCGAYCLESFDPRCVYWLKKNRPELIRGQLSVNYLRSSRSKLPFYQKIMLTHQMANFLLQPHFVAYKFDDRKTLSMWLVRKLWGAQVVTWTVKTQADYDTAIAEGYLPIFEGFRP